MNLNKTTLVAFLGLALCLSYIAAAVCCTSNESRERRAAERKQALEAVAKKFASKIPGSTGDVSCITLDSDSDGFVSCTVFMKTGAPTPIECMSPWTSRVYASVGCKMNTKHMRAPLVPAGPARQ